MFDFDWDEVLAYQTVRTARIRNRKLGALYYSSMFSIFMFIFGNNIIAKKGYLALVEPTKSLRIQMKGTGKWDQPKDTSQLPYCTNNLCAYYDEKDVICK